MAKASNNPAIMIVDSEEGVVNDVACSLRLVDFKVMIAKSIEDAAKSAAITKPDLIITRPRVGGNERAAVELVQGLRKRKGLEGLPVAVMCTHSELGLIEEDQDLFGGLLALPVEFPAFTLEVQRILHGSDDEKGVAVKSEVMRDEALAAPEQTTAADVLREQADRDIDIRRLNSNLLIAYEIQHAVMDELRSNKAFASVRAESVADVVLDVTRKVCTRLKSR